VQNQSKNETKGWKLAIFEEFLHESILKKHKKAGYKDYKNMIYGNKEDGPLSIAISGMIIEFFPYIL
jgi:hypothetical protein